MGRVALQMLWGDRAKYFGLIFGIAFSSMLMAHQTAIFCGLMRRTTSQIEDVRDAHVWVMDPQLQNIDEIKPLSDGDLYRVRGVPGVAWASKLHKGLARLRVPAGEYRTAILMGLDDATLVGAPRQMLLGDIGNLAQPDGVIIDDAGYAYLFPGEPLELGRELEMNDRRAVVTGICRASPPFQTFPVVFTRFSQATKYVPRERNTLSFILVGTANTLNRATVASDIARATGLQALTREAFSEKTIGYYLSSTGIPVNFGITILLGFIVGAAIAGQTFFLFVIENLKQFGALKAMGLSNARILAMVLLQALVVGVIGYALGMGAASFFFEATQGMPHLRGFFLPWQVAGGTVFAVGLIVVGAALLSVRRVWVLEPAVVFRG